MRTLLTSLMIFCFATVSLAQKKLIGEWKITGQKQLSLYEDSTFKLVKGTYNYDGTWSFNKIKKANDELILTFATGVKKYFVEKLKKDEVRLYDPSKDQIMILTRIEEEEEVKEAIQEPSTNSKLASMSKQEVLDDLYPFDHFEKGRLVVSPGYGVIDYLDSFPTELSNKVPSISLLIEKSLGSRFGLGLKGGYRSWTIPETTYSLSLSSIAARLTYHPRLVNKLDAFLGVGATLRYGTLNDGSIKTSKWSNEITPVIGARYYMLKRFALTGEFAYDTSSNVTLGFAILLN